MADDNEIDAYRKLERIKDIRTKMVHFEKLKSKLHNAVGTVELEDKCLQEYKAELELLVQEKMAHVEELRLIHADINMLETTIKQAEEERSKAVESVRHLISDFAPLRSDIDLLCASLGIEPQRDSTLDEQKLCIERILEKQRTEPRPAIDMGVEPVGGGPSLVAFPQPLATALPHAAKVDMRQPPQSVSLMLRQQPPPMKACLSCHQQIHRNAPICPLCKAKSRSRNPKKPKRKSDDN